MSDNWIALIPVDPNKVPDSERQQQALSHFWSLAPDADEIEIKESDHLIFFDCGSNLERIICPHCDGQISIDWWQDQMGEDYEDECLSLRAHSLPCCDRIATMAELKYEWPQGFARFGIDAMNPKIGTLLDEEKARFEEILGVPLRIIYQHL
jgi:hypothetical protein